MASTTETVQNGHQEGPERRTVVQLDGAKLTRERKRTLRLMDTLPKGITIGERHDGRPKPFFVRYGTPRKTESFVTETDRNDQAEKLRDQAVANGTSVLNFDPAEWAEFQRWKASRRAVMPIKEAVEKYLALRLNEDVVKDSDTHLHMDLHLRRLVEKFGERSVDAGVTADELRTWLPSIVSPKTGKPIGKVTQNHHRKEINQFFKRAVAERWAAENPCTTVRRVRVDDEDKVPLKPKEVFDLLKHNRDEKVVGRLVLELFGGLRSSSAGRLRREDIRDDRRGIRMPGSRRDEETGELAQNHKSGRTKYRQGHPDVLWAWIAFAPAACWSEVSAKNYDYLKGQAFVRARVKNPGNVLRDSFVSYMLAYTKNFPLVSYLAQHTRSSTTEGYEGIVEEADAKLVMAMTPDAVLLEWDAFLASQTDSPAQTNPQTAPK